MESTQPQGGLELASDFRQSSSVHSGKKVFICSDLRDKTEENKNTHKKNHMVMNLKALEHSHQANWH